MNGLVILWFILAYIAWMALGRAIVLLAMNEFVWSEFVESWKNHDDEVIDILLYFIFPLSLIIYFSENGRT